MGKQEFLVPPGAYKMNDDTVVPLNGNKTGSGAIIRDSEGFVMAALAKSIHGKISSKSCRGYGSKLIHLYHRLWMLV